MIPAHLGLPVAGPTHASKISKYNNTRYIGLYVLHYFVFENRL